MLLSKQKKNQAAKGNRFLISVTVLGSAGPIRFLVSEDELVGAVIDIALKSYAREGRLPVLGSDTDDFILYCPIAGFASMGDDWMVGRAKLRAVQKKPRTDVAKAVRPRNRKTAGAGIWKAWFTKSRSLKISFH